MAVDQLRHGRPRLAAQVRDVFEAYPALGHLDAAAAAVRPILELPPERQISWIHKRLDRFDAMLLGPRYAGSREASDLHDEIQALAA